MTLQKGQSIIGVRLSGSSRLCLVAGDAWDVSPGSRLTLRTERGEESAQVIISPDQLVAFSNGSPDPVASHADPRSIGGVGWHDPSRQNVSREDELFRRVKRGLPRLGQHLDTDRGSATVMSVDVVNESAIIRYDETGEQEALPATALLNLKNPNLEDE